MKNIKLIALITISCILLFSSACKDCEAPTISKNIIGIWKETESGFIVEMKEDGTLIDDDALLYDDSSLETLDVKYFEVYREEYVTFTAESSTVNSSTTAAWGIDKNSCDKIRLEANDGNSVYYLTLVRQ